MKFKVIACIVYLSAFKAFAFCGFYVAKADSKLFNKASQVVLVRDENRNVITMASDYEGDLKEFAMVVPVPVVLQKEQVHVGESKWIDHLDAFSAPRLVEYYDEDPCQPKVRQDMMMLGRGGAVPMAASQPSSAASLGVKIEASYSVGEYDILILSAKQSDGLETWLMQNGYKIPAKAGNVLKPYILQNMKFFVAKVNLKEIQKEKITKLRPLQMAFDSEKFMLPIRLGMVNARGDQDMIVYAITKNGRVETSNYRVVKLPSAEEIPVYVKNKFESFYKDMFEKVHTKENKSVVILEHFWDMNWCDPCVSEPLSQEELKGLGVYWADPNSPSNRRIGIWPGPMPSSSVLLTRLHVRYNNQTFPEDLHFFETKDRNNYQARFVLRHPWQGKEDQCPQAKTYFNDLKARQAKEASTLAHLTGWSIQDIQKEMKIESKPKPWWKDLWN